MPRTQLTNSTTVTLTRVGSAATLNWLGYVVEFTDQTSVQHGSFSFGSSDASQTATISAVLLDRSSVYGTGNFGRQGSTAFASDDNPGYNWAYFEFNNTTQVKGTRAATGSTAEIPFQVASFRFDQTSPPASHTDPTGPFTNVTLNRIRRGTETMSSAQTSISVTVDNMQTDSSFLVFSVRNPSTDPGTGFIGGRITNSTTLTFSRATSGTTAIIDWQVFSFTNGVWVQRGSTTISSTTQNQSITSVSLTKSFPIISYTKTGNIYGDDDGYIADISSATNLQFRSTATGATVYWQVVEIQDSLVRRSVISLADGIATLNGDFGCGTTNGATPGRSFVVSSQQWSGDLNSDDMPRVFLNDSLSVTATRVGTANTVNIVAYIVELFDGTTVQHGDITISGSNNSATATLTANDPDYSGYIGPGHLGSQGSSTYTTDDNVGHNWTAFNLTNTTTITAQRGSTGATTIAPYQVISFANYEVALPVSLVQFTGVRLENDEVLLRWVTATERDNAHFTVQRSPDGQIFSSIGSKTGNGTTNTVREYSFTDDAPPGGDLYYRLIQTDLNRTDHFSNILLLPAKLLTEAQDFDLRIFPVPTRDVLLLELENYTQGAALISIIDLHGKIWQQQPWTPAVGRDNIQMAVNALPHGTYVLQLQTLHTSVTRRFVKY